MNWNKSLSWKITLPLGIILYIIGYGGAIGFLGLIIGALGIVDLIRFLVNKYKTKKPENQK